MSVWVGMLCFAICDSIMSVFVRIVPRFRSGLAIKQYEGGCYHKLIIDKASSRVWDRMISPHNWYNLITLAVRTEQRLSVWVIGEVKWKATHLADVYM
jgi:hypothetical protein